MIRKINYISHFDKNYLVQGLTLINNLKEKSNFSKIIVVALDDFTKLALLKLNLKDLIVIEISKVLENQNINFKNKTTNREYIWTLTPIIIRYISNSYNSEYIVYLDADMFLLRSDHNVVESFIKSKRSAFITPHFYAPNLDQTESSGRFCVQYLIFNLSNSSDIIEDWVEDCLNDCSENQSVHGMGDQKYLTFWEDKYKNRIYLAPNSGLFLAPWNLNFYRYSDAVFFHFQGFRLYKNKFCILINGYEINKYTKKYVYFKYVREIKKNMRILMDNQIIKKEKIFFTDYLYVFKVQLVYSLKNIIKQILNNFPKIVKKI
tara:strand:- start:13786 stop:14742 length:957 start_codon:yes stop_codon:yes gene_type:complete